jgi:hypothetical protein
MTTTRRQILASIAAFSATACVRPDTAVGAEPTPARPPGNFHRGMAVAHIHQSGLGYGTTTSRGQLRKLVDMGISHVALTPFGYLPDIGGTRLVYGASMDRTLSDEGVVREAVAAKELGLKVCLKPHVWSNSFYNGKSSRADVDPGAGKWSEWFDNYAGFAEHYAKLATACEADLYVVGLEFLKATQKNPGAWGQIAKRCRAHYGGAITYGANWYREADDFSDWADFDVIGVNAYPPLGKDASSAGLQQAWRGYLKGIGSLSRKHGRDVILTEAGCRSVHRAFEEPWDQGRSGKSAPEEQARVYEALLSCMGDAPFVKGLYFWKWFTAPGGERDQYVPSASTQRVIHTWWSSP